MAKLDPAPNGYPIKLVRDLTPKVINASGKPGELFYGQIPYKEIGPWLRRKLAEEVHEYFESRTVAELEDVIAVIEALAIVEHDTSLEELTPPTVADERGGFVLGVMMYGRHPEFDG